MGTWGWWLSDNTITIIQQKKKKKKKTITIKLDMINDVHYHSALDNKKK